MKIKDIPTENRPRERLFREGASALSSAELLAVVLLFCCFLLKSKFYGLFSYNFVDVFEEKQGIIQ